MGDLLTKLKSASLVAGAALLVVACGNSGETTDAAATGTTDATAAPATDAATTTTTTETTTTETTGQ